MKRVGYIYEQMAQWENIVEAENVATKRKNRNPGVQRHIKSRFKNLCEIQQMVIEDKLSTGHARALLGIEDPELQAETALKVFDEKLSVREVEKLVKNIQSGKEKKKKEAPVHDFIYTDLEEKMKAAVGSKVSIHQKAKGSGKIEIEYYSREDLERIIDLITHVSQE